MKIQRQAKQKFELDHEDILAIIENALKQQGLIDDSYTICADDITPITVVAQNEVTSETRPLIVPHTVESREDCCDVEKIVVPTKLVAITKVDSCLQMPFEQLNSADANGVQNEKNVVSERIMTPDIFADG
jgi:hypothetical protein